MRKRERTRRAAKTAAWDLRPGRAVRRPISVGFAPVARDDARILILGSLPGTASLAAGQYYAQPYNSFWRIMGVLVGAEPRLPYEERCALLRARGIALWDVFHSAHRPGSLDASIARETAQANDFAGFFATHTRIERIGLNGATAASAFERLVLPRLAEPLRALPRLRLPSTSPAHATLSFEQKLLRWARLLEN